MRSQRGQLAGILAVARWGLSERERLKWVDSSPEEIVANHPKLAKEAYAMLETAYARALRLIRQRASQVRAIANALIKRRALAHADILALLEAPQPGGGQARPRSLTRKRA